MPKLPPSSLLASTQSAEPQGDDGPPDFDPQPTAAPADADGADGAENTAPASAEGNDSAADAAPARGAAADAPAAGAAVSMAPQAQARNFAEPTRPQPAVGAAPGWHAAMAAAADASHAGQSGADAAEGEAAAQHEAGTEEEGVALEEDVDAQECPADAPAPSGDVLELFFLDAHYEPAQNGTVYLIGKARQGAANSGGSSGAAEYVSACVAVHNIKQTLFVVPKPFVFEDSDGELERCAAATF